MPKIFKLSNILFLRDEEVGTKYEGSEEKGERPWVVIKEEKEHLILVALTGRKVKSYTGHKHKKLSYGSYIRTDNHIVKVKRDFVYYNSLEKELSTEDMKIIFNLIGKEEAYWEVRVI